MVVDREVVIEITAHFLGSVHAAAQIQVEMLGKLGRHRGQGVCLDLRRDAQIRFYRFYRSQQMELLRKRKEFKEERHRKYLEEHPDKE